MRPYLLVALYSEHALDRLFAVDILFRGCLEPPARRRVQLVRLCFTGYLTRSAAPDRVWVGLPV